MAKPAANIHILAGEIFSLAAQLEQCAASEKWSECTLVLSTICANITRIIGNLSDIDKPMAESIAKQIASEQVNVFGEFANIEFTQTHPHGYPDSLKEDDQGSVATAPPTE